MRNTSSLFDVYDQLFQLSFNTLTSLEKKLSNEWVNDFQKNKIILSAFINEVFTKANVLKYSEKNLDFEEVQKKRKKIKKSLKKCFKVLDLNDTQKVEKISEIDFLENEMVFLKLHFTIRKKQRCITGKFRLNLRWLLDLFNEDETQG